MKWFKDLDDFIQFIIVIVFFWCLFGIYNLLDKLIDKL